MSKSPANAFPDEEFLVGFDPNLMDFDLKRKRGSRKYSRMQGETKQQIDFHFLRPRYSDDHALANIQVFLEVQMADVYRKALSLVEDPWFAGESTIRQGIGLV